MQFQSSLSRPGASFSTGGSYESAEIDITSQATELNRNDHSQREGITLWMDHAEGSSRGPSTPKPLIDPGHVRAIPRQPSVEGLYSMKNPAKLDDVTA